MQPVVFVYLQAAIYEHSHRIIMYLNRNIWIGCLVVFTSMAMSACAQTKKSTAKKKITDKLVLLQATRQKTNPGREEGEPLVEYRFVVIWKSAKEPAAFCYFSGSFIRRDVYTLSGIC